MSVMDSTCSASVECKFECDAARELLQEHVVQGLKHPGELTASLAPLIRETLDAATSADWRHVADQLVADVESIGPVSVDRRSSRRVRSREVRCDGYRHRA